MRTGFPGLTKNQVIFVWLLWFGLVFLSNPQIVVNLWLEFGENLFWQFMEECIFRSPYSTIPELLSIRVYLRLILTAHFKNLNHSLLLDALCLPRQHVLLSFLIIHLSCPSIYWVILFSVASKYCSDFGNSPWYSYLYTIFPIDLQVMALNITYMDDA